ncbi:heparanase-like protein 3 [Zea mays]|uniref:heparanase-like protein 3 n=1 Tax=Zea mays TaxID=4577 RepID=UPI0009A9A1AF|nr:heparanase-like protein 3 [Zea mays]|eukprot:XP_020398167.1 heparanase-like protein 3 [Zea mays]
MDMSTLLMDSEHRAPLPPTKTSRGSHTRRVLHDLDLVLFVFLVGLLLGEAAAGAVRHEYHLTPKDGDLTSQVVLLNGRALATDAAGNIPALEAVEVDAARPIAVTPYSIVFARVPHFSAPACRVE